MRGLDYEIPPFRGGVLEQGHQPVYWGGVGRICRRFSGEYPRDRHVKRLRQLGEGGYGKILIAALRVAQVIGVYAGQVRGFLYCQAVLLP